MWSPTVPRFVWLASPAAPRAEPADGLDVSAATYTQTGGRPLHATRRMRNAVSSATLEAACFPAPL